MANKITTILDLQADAFTKSWKDATKAIKEADGSVAKFKAGWSGAMDGFRRHSKEAAVAGGVAFTAFAAKAIGEASELDESINAVNVTFGDTASEVLKLGENSAKSFGLAKSEFNQLAVQFSSFAKNIAAGSGQSVGTVLEDLTTRVADFASVMNLDLSEATQVFMSTMSGETEPIRRFGKDVSAAAVEQFALSKGLIKTKDELTETIKVQARYGLLMEQTADTHGDFANTADGLANTQRILSAQLKDTAAKVGQDLTPALLELLQTVQALTETADKLHLAEVFSLPNELFDQAQQAGRWIRMSLDGVAEANWNAVAAFNESEQAAKGFDRELLKNARSVGEVRAIVVQYTGDQHAANVVATEWAETQGLAQGQTLDQKEALDAQTDALQKARGQQESYVDLLKQRGIAAIEAAREATARQTRAILLNVSALKKQRDAAVDAVDTIFDYQEAQIAAADEVDAYREAVEGGETSLRDLQGMQISSAQALKAQADAFAVSKGAADGSNASLALQRDELIRLKEQYPELAGYIQQYIDKLNAIPGLINTQVLINGSGAYTAQLTGATGRIIDAGVAATTRTPTVQNNPRQFATGGVVGGPVGAPQMVIAHGGETILPTHKSGAGVGNTYNVTFNVSQAMTPEQTMDMIRRWENRNGTGWRG